jgi:hypothetical protein
LPRTEAPASVRRASQPAEVGPRPLRWALANGGLVPLNRYGLTPPGPRCCPGQMRQNSRGAGSGSFDVTPLHPGGKGSAGVGTATNTDGGCELVGARRSIALFRPLRHTRPVSTTATVIMGRVHHAHVHAGHARKAHLEGVDGARTELIRIQFADVAANVTHTGLSHGAEPVGDS